MIDNNGDDTPIVSMEKIVKRFGRVTALSGVDFSVRRQEVMALLGDNGAGKSTLIKILTGVYPPTEGNIFFAGKLVHIRNPRKARSLGIETVYQDLALVNLMSISRNFFLGRELVRFGPIGWLDLRAMTKQTQESLADIGIKIRSANEKVTKLSGGERQSIAIGRAVHFGSRLLILDEPTTALSVTESRKVLEYVLNAKASGMSVILISHNIHQVMQVADRCTIIRHGKTVGTYKKDELTESEISDLVAGLREC